MRYPTQCANIHSFSVFVGFLAQQEAGKFTFKVSAKRGQKWGKKRTNFLDTFFGTYLGSKLPDSIKIKISILRSQGSRMAESFPYYIYADVKYLSMLHVRGKGIGSYNK